MIRPKMWAVLSWETWSVNVNSPALIDGLQEGVLWIQPHHMLLDGCHPCVCTPSRFSQVQLFVTPMDCSLPGFSVHGILQARILESVAMHFSRESSRPRDWTWFSYVSCIGRWFFTSSTTWEAQVGRIDLPLNEMENCRRNNFVGSFKICSGHAKFEKLFKV